MSDPRRKKKRREDQHTQQTQSAAGRNGVSIHPPNADEYFDINSVEQQQSVMPVSNQHSNQNQGPPPPVSAPDQTLYVPEGFVHAQFRAAHQEAANPDNSLAARAGMFALGTLAFPLAMAEEYIVRPIANIPYTVHNAGRSIGEHTARAVLFARQGETGEATVEGLHAIQSFSEGFVAAGSVAAPLASRAAGGANVARNTGQQNAHNIVYKGGRWHDARGRFVRNPNRAATRSSRSTTGATSRARPVATSATSTAASARTAFNRLRKGFAQRLGVGRGGQVHHAIELQTLDRYPGVFRANELNRLSNMRGIPAERGGLRQLHNSKIREFWDRHYSELDHEIINRNLQPGTNAYNSYVRQVIENCRDGIDDAVGQFFSEYRRTIF